MLGILCAAMESMAWWSLSVSSARSVNGEFCEELLIYLRIFISS